MLNIVLVVFVTIGCAHATPPIKGVQTLQQYDC